MTLIKLNKHNPVRTGRFSPMFDEVFSDFFGGGLMNTFNKAVAVNIKEDEKSYQLEFAAPGYEKEEFKIGVENQLLTVSADKKDEKSEEGRDYTRREFAYSSFQRSFNLPESVNSDAIKAEYKNGVLQVFIPKKVEENKQKREISID